MRQIIVINNGKNRDCHLTIPYIPSIVHVVGTQHVSHTYLVAQHYEYQNFR